MKKPLGLIGAKPIQRVSKKLKWKAWFTILLLWAVAYYLARISVPAFPYYYDYNLFYPWLILYNSIVFHLLFLAVGIVFGLCLYYSLKSFNRAIVRDLLIGLCMFACAGSCVATNLPPYLFAPSLDHINSTQFQGKTYQLALSYGSSPDWDYILAVYIVYECDSLGMMCHRHYCPFYESVGSNFKRQSTDFIVDTSTNTLFVQIGQEKTKVRKRCRYWGG